MRVESCGGEVISGYLADIGEQGRAGEPVMEDAAGLVVDLDGGGDADAGPCERKVEGAHSGEQGDGGQVCHAVTPSGMRFL